MATTPSHTSPKTLTIHQHNITTLTEPQPNPASRSRIETKQFTIDDAPVDLRDSGGGVGDASGRKTVDYVLHTSAATGAGRGGDSAADPYGVCDGAVAAGVMGRISR